MGLDIVIVALANLTCGVLFIALAAPLQFGIVRRNNFYGVRFRQAMESDEAWTKINRFGGHWLSAWGVLLALLGAALLVWPNALTKSTVDLLAFAPASVVLPALITWVYAVRSADGPGVRDGYPSAELERAPRIFFALRRRDSISVSMSGWESCRSPVSSMARKRLISSSTTG